MVECGGQVKVAVVKWYLTERDSLHGFQTNLHARDVYAHTHTHTRASTHIRTYTHTHTHKMSVTGIITVKMTGDIYYYGDNYHRQRKHRLTFNSTIFPCSEVAMCACRYVRVWTVIGACIRGPIAFARASRACCVR